MFVDVIEAQERATLQVQGGDTPSDEESTPSSGYSEDTSSPNNNNAATAAAASEAPSSPSSSAADTDALASTNSGVPYAPADREWLYRLVTFPSYFTPCPNCCGTNKAPKREQLVTHFDTAAPFHVYCSHCPEHKTRASTLLQVRRSAFKDVVKATDILALGCDILGVQQYTLNGSKVVYLSREQSPDKKGTSASAAPAVCSVDGRAMMDRTSVYCSLKCKLVGEDAAFCAWLRVQDPSVIAAATAAANAPPRPTVACKRVASTQPPLPANAAPRPKKAARTGPPTPTATSAPATPAAAAGAFASGPRPPPRRGAKAPVAAAAMVPTAGAAAQQLPPIRTASTTSTSAFSLMSRPSGLAPLDIPGCDDDNDDAVLVSTRGSGGLADWMDTTPGLDHALSTTSAWGLIDEPAQQPPAASTAAAAEAAVPARQGSAAADPWPSSPTFQDMFSDGMDSGSWGDDMMGGDGSSGSSSDWWFAASPRAVDFDADMGFGREGSFGSEASAADMLLPPAAPKTEEPKSLAPAGAPAATVAAAKGGAAVAAVAQAQVQPAAAAASAAVAGPGVGPKGGAMMMPAMPFGYGMMGPAGFAAPAMPFFPAPWMGAPMAGAFNAQQRPQQQQQQQQQATPAQAQQAPTAAAASHAAAAAAMAAAAASVCAPGGNKEWTYSAPSAQQQFYMAAAPMRCPGCMQVSYMAGGFCSACMAAAASRQQQGANAPAAAK